jgi:hypothetical protein
MSAKVGWAVGFIDWLGALHRISVGRNSGG